MVPWYFAKSHRPFRMILLLIVENKLEINMTSRSSQVNKAHWQDWWQPIIKQTAPSVVSHRNTPWRYVGQFGFPEPCDCTVRGDICLHISRSCWLWSFSWAGGWGQRQQDRTAPIGMGITLLPDLITVEQQVHGVSTPGHDDLGHTWASDWELAPSCIQGVYVHISDDWLELMTVWPCWVDFRLRTEFVFYFPTRGSMRRSDNQALEALGAAARFHAVPMYQGHERKSRLDSAVTSWPRVSVKVVMAAWPRVGICNHMAKLWCLLNTEVTGM